MMQDLSQIQVTDLEDIGPMKLLLNADAKGVKAADWVSHNKDHIERLLKENGALLIRGLQIHSSKQFGNILSEVFAQSLLKYRFRSTPRTELRDNVYTATEYHSDQVIAQHNENAYTNNWPMRIGFLCLLPAATGGETPIGDSRKIYPLIPANIREKFEQKGIMYVRNYADIDLPWQQVFQTEDKSQVEQFCRANNIEFEWLDNNGLRTRQVNPAVAVHPDSGEKIWFNQAHLFHTSALPDDIRNNLMAQCGEDSLPRNAYYGDGSAIDPADLALIRDIYSKNRVNFVWEKSDLMLLDNMMFTHGREPFSGERKTLVGMARPHSHSSPDSIEKQQNHTK
jgi:alpha-ketoglutarate-dependent taurine dioxygenase